MNKNEVINRIETFKVELGYLKNPHFQENAEILLELLPEYFFHIPASSTGKYHPTFSLGEGGLVRHTKAAVRIAHELLENDSIGYVFSDDEKDMILLSLLVHDGVKEGIPQGKYTIFDHPIVVANLIREHQKDTTLTDQEVALITTMIESHMGQWNTNPYSNVVLPKPQNKYQKFVHMCDFLSSRKFLDIKFENDHIVD